MADLFRFVRLDAPRRNVELRAIDEFATDHHGVVTRDAAMRHGMSRAGWYRALRDGTLEALHPGVARLIGTPDTREQRIAAAVCGAGRGAMASHRSAARLWGVPRPESDPIDIILDDRRREADLRGVVIHRPRDRKDLSPVRRRNVRCSNILRSSATSVRSMSRPSRQRWVTS